MANMKQDDMKSIYEKEDYTVTPLAGAVHPPQKKDAWEYKISKEIGKTNKVTSQMTVPGTSTPRSIFVRAHELAHARFSPSKKPAGLKEEERMAYEIIEEGRVWALMKERGVLPVVWEGHEGALDELYLKHKGKFESDPVEATYASIANGAWKVDDENMAIPDEVRQFIHRLYDEYLTDTVKNKDPRQLLKWTRELMELLPYPRFSMPKSAGDLMPAHGEEPEGEKPMPFKGPSFERFGTPGGRGLATIESRDGWAKMEMQYPPLVRPSKAMLNSKIRRTRRTDMGAIPKWIHRVVDRKSVV